MASSTWGTSATAGAASAAGAGISTGLASVTGATGATAVSGADIIVKMRSELERKKEISKRGEQQERHRVYTHERVLIGKRERICVLRSCEPAGIDGEVERNKEGGMESQTFLATSSFYLVRSVWSLFGHANHICPQGRLLYGTLSRKVGALVTPPYLTWGFKFQSSRSLPSQCTECSERAGELLRVAPALSTCNC